MGSSSGQSNGSYDLSFKILLIGDSGVGKSSLHVSFISASTEDLAPTIAGQERFRTLTSSYYRGAQGIMLVYDVTRRETLTNLSDVWAKEVELYSTNPDCIKILVGNKVDRDSERAELALKIMEVPSFLEEGSAVGKRNILKQKPEGKAHQRRGCCS
ncbi:hypothetical protein V6N13_131307 [Hibiscus sabdariffa]|uniref:Uncharacterized protein n=1 Tax=Hibiscus sabdariffa TaxID=183260 RepID=A0ABR2D7H1_9ROSI